MTNNEKNIIWRILSQPFGAPYKKKEKWEAKTPAHKPLSPEEEQIVRMPWLKEHIIDE